MTLGRGGTDWHPIYPNFASLVQSLAFHQKIYPKTNGVAYFGSA
jgi:hypothetical protein